MDMNIKLWKNCKLLILVKFVIIPKWKNVDEKM